MAAPAALDSTGSIPRASSGIRRERAGRPRERQDEALHQMSQRHLPQAKEAPQHVLVQLRVVRQEQREGQEHEQHQHFESSDRIVPSSPSVLGIHRRRERPEGVVLDRPPQMGEFAHLERREGLIGRDDPEVLHSPVAPFDPIEMNVSDLQRMRHVAVPQAGNGLNVKGYAPSRINPSGFFDRTGPALEDLFGVAQDDQRLFGAFHQEMGAELFPAEANHALADVQTVPQDHVQGLLAMTLEEAAQKNLSRRKLLASILTRLKIGDRGMSAQNLEHARIASREHRAVDGRRSKRTAFGQRDLAVALLAKEHAGLLKLFTDLRLIHPWEDSPEGGVGSDQVPRGAQPLPDVLLSSEEIHLVKALAMERQTPDQEQEQRRHGDLGVLAELRKAPGLLAEMELVVAECRKVCQTGRCPLLPIVQARRKREKRSTSEPGRFEAPLTYRSGGGFTRAPRRREIQQSSERGFSLFSGAVVASHPTNYRWLE